MAPSTGRPGPAQDAQTLVPSTRRPVAGPFTRWPRVADAVLALVAFLVILVVSPEGPDDELAVRGADEVSIAALVVCAVASGVLSWRRSQPLVVFGVTLTLALAATVPSAGLGDAETVGIAMMFALYAVGRHAGNDRWGYIALGGALAFVTISSLIHEETPAALGFGLCFTFVVWYSGRRLRIRGERAAQLEREQAAEARRAVAEERTRIARELHDVVAHRVSLMTVQAGAAKTVAADDPESASQAMHAVEQAGRQALDELRHLLGVLRPEADGEALGPQPGLADVPRLVDQFGEAGLDVSLKMDGAQIELPARVDLSAYRIVQEALTNALKHAGPGARTEVRLHADTRGVDIEVLDNGRGGTILTRSGHRGRRHAGAGAAVGGTPRRRAPCGWRLPRRCASTHRSVAGVRIRVAVVDDQALVRGGLAMVLGHQDDIEVVAEAGTGLEAIEVARTHRPDVILMDIRMPEMDGLEATARIVEEADWPVRVLILTTFEPDAYVYRALRAGASGFVLKDIPPEELPTAVRTVASGGALLAPSITRRLISQFAQRLAVDTAVSARLERLTDREREVLAAIARGSSNAEIAEELFIGAATVKSHVSSILTKLGLRDRAQVVVFAYESGLVEAGERDIGH